MADSQIDEIFDVIDELLLAGNFKAVGLILKLVITDLDSSEGTDILLSLLTITNAAKRHPDIIESRNSLFGFLDSDLTRGLEC